MSEMFNGKKLTPLDDNLTFNGKKLTPLDMPTESYGIGNNLPKEEDYPFKTLVDTIGWIGDNAEKVGDNLENPIDYILGGSKRVQENKLKQNAVDAMKQIDSLDKTSLWSNIIKNWKEGEDPNEALKARDNIYRLYDQEFKKRGLGTLGKDNGGNLYLITKDGRNLSLDSIIDNIAGDTKANAGVMAGAMAGFSKAPTFANPYLTFGSKALGSAIGSFGGSLLDTTINSLSTVKDFDAKFALRKAGEEALADAVIGTGLEAGLQGAKFINNKFKSLRDWLARGNIQGAEELAQEATKKPLAELHNERLKYEKVPSNSIDKGKEARQDQLASAAMQEKRLWNEVAPTIMGDVKASTAVADTVTSRANKLIELAQNGALSEKEVLDAIKGYEDTVRSDYSTMINDLQRILPDYKVDTQDIIGAVQDTMDMLGSSEIKGHLKAFENELKKKSEYTIEDLFQLRADLNSIKAENIIDKRRIRELNERLNDKIEAGINTIGDKELASKLKQGFDENRARYKEMLDMQDSQAYKSIYKNSIDEASVENAMYKYATSIKGDVNVGKDIEQTLNDITKHFTPEQRAGAEMNVITKLIKNNLLVSEDGIHKAVDFKRLLEQLEKVQTSNLKSQNAKDLVEFVRGMANKFNLDTQMLNDVKHGRVKGLSEGMGPDPVSRLNTAKANILTKLLIRYIPFMQVGKSAALKHHVLDSLRKARTATEFLNLSTDYPDIPPSLWRQIKPLIKEYEKAVEEEQTIKAQKEEAERIAREERIAKQEEAVTEEADTSFFGELPTDKKAYESVREYALTTNEPQAMSEWIAKSKTPFNDLITIVKNNLGREQANLTKELIERRASALGKTPDNLAREMPIEFYRDTAGTDFHKTHDGVFYQKSEKDRITSLMPFNMMGTKNHLLADTKNMQGATISFADMIKDIAQKSKRVIDAFGGAGTYTHFLSDLGMLPKGSILNEFDNFRAVTHKWIKEAPEEVDKHVNEIMNRLKKYDGIEVDYYNQAIIKESQAYLDELAQSTYASRVKDKNGMLPVYDNPRTAAVYIVLQEHALRQLPINADGKTIGGSMIVYKVNKGTSWAKVQGKFKIGEENGRPIYAPPEGSVEFRTKHIDSVKDKSYRMKDVQVKQGDGWELIAKDAKKDDFVLVDTSYLNKVKEDGTIIKTTNYNKATAEDAVPDIYKEKIEKYVIPAIERGANVVITNNWDDGVASFLRSKGLYVYKGARQDAEELIATNRYYGNSYEPRGDTLSRTSDTARDVGRNGDIRTRNSNIHDGTTGENSIHGMDARTEGDVSEVLWKDGRGTNKGGNGRLEEPKVKGSYSPDDNIIRIFKEADSSTLTHELGHRFLFTLTDTEKDLVKRVYGKNVSDFTADDHELFANQFIRYIAEGKVQHSGLKAIFEKMKQFILRMFEDLKANNGGRLPKISKENQMFFKAMLGDEKDRIALKKHLDIKDAKRNARQKKIDYKKKHNVKTADDFIRVIAKAQKTTHKKTPPTLTKYLKAWKNGTVSSAIQKCTRMQCKNVPLSNTYLLEISNNPASLFCFNL